jgi:hypothetical protein
MTPAIGAVFMSLSTIIVAINAELLSAPASRLIHDDQERSFADPTHDAAKPALASCSASTFAGI